MLRNPKEQEARQMMADHYKAHRHELPDRIRQYPEFIVELIMGGMSAEEAYAMALAK